MCGMNGLEAIADTKKVIAIANGTRLARLV